MSSNKGSVRWFNNAKGFGFLSSESGADVFVHYSCIEAEGYQSLREGQEVEYDIETGSGGKPQAMRVRRLNVPRGAGETPEKS